MWNSNNPDLWQKALNRYWTFVKSSNLALEKEMEVHRPEPLCLDHEDAQELCGKQRAIDSRII
jgi:hypothetical protein